MAENLARWRIAATGTVQLVNYRERVQHAAAAHHIVGSVENDEKDDERVLVDAQGSSGDLLDFIEAIRGPEGRSDARDVVKTKEVEPDLTLTRFLIKRGRTRQETLERVEFARHALTALGSEIESLRGELKSQFERVEESVERLDGALERASGASSDREKALDRTLAALEQELDRGLSALGKRLEALAEARAKADRDVQARLERLDHAFGAIEKSLARLERSLDQEAEEQEQQARDAEQQRAALLHLAGQLANAGPTRPRRHRSRR